jgi:2'-5' RNA ligase
MALEQLSFPGFRSASPAGLPPTSRHPSERYFFAVQVPPETRPTLGALTAGLAVEHGLSGGPRPLKNLHAVLLPLGDYPVQQPELVAMARRFAAAIQAKPFSVTWDRVRSFPRAGDRPGPVALCGGDGVKGLVGLHERFRIAMAERGLIEPAPAGFTPHVTLLHDRDGITEQAVTPIGWRVTEFVLVHSLLGQSQHIVLGRWPLRG